MISITNLTVRNRLDNINLNLDDNKFISIIGENGSGKTTLFSSIMNFNKIDSGSIKINGLDSITTSPEILSKKICILEQSNKINLKIKIPDFLKFGRYPYSKNKLTKEDEDYVYKIMKKFDFDESFYDSYITELSGGEYQRLMIALKFVQDSDIILLDEPMNNLDIRQSLKILKLLKDRVDKDKKTVICVLHDINQIINYSDKVVVLNKGKVKYNLTKEEILDEMVLTSIYGVKINLIKTECSKYICSYY